MEVIRFDVKCNFDPKLLRLKARKSGQKLYVTILYNNKQLALRLPKQILNGIYASKPKEPEVKAKKCSLASGFFLPYTVGKNEESKRFLDFMKRFKEALGNQLEEHFSIDRKAIKDFITEKPDGEQVCFISMTDGISQLKDFGAHKLVLAKSLRTYGEYIPVAVPKLSIPSKESDIVYSNFFCNYLYLNSLGDAPVKVDEMDIIGADFTGQMD